MKKICQPMIAIIMTVIATSVLAQRTRIDITYDQSKPGTMAMTANLKDVNLNSIIVGGISVGSAGRIDGLGIEYYRASDEIGQMTDETDKTVYWCREIGQNHPVGLDGKISCVLTGSGEAKRRNTDGSAIPENVKLDAKLRCRIMPGIVIDGILYLVNTGVVDTYLNGQSLTTRKSPDPKQPGDSYYLNLSSATALPIATKPAIQATDQTTIILTATKTPRAKATFTADEIKVEVEIDLAGRNITDLFDNGPIADICGVGIYYSTGQEAWIAPLPDYWPAYITIPGAFKEPITEMAVVVQNKTGTLHLAKIGQWDINWIIKSPAITVTKVESSPTPPAVTVTPEKKPASKIEQPTPKVPSAPEKKPILEAKPAELPKSNAPSTNQPVTGNEGDEYNPK